MLLGIDIGTSSVKSTLFDPQSGRILARAAQEYPIYKPLPTYAEQSPDDWWHATISVIRQVLEGRNHPEISAIGLCGQMHGTILLGGNHQPIHPAIMWADQRSASECDELIALLGTERYASIAGTLPAAGFMAATLLWLRKHDPALLDQTHVVLLPKDYIRLKLTGEIASDPSDAAATALFDITDKHWSPEIIRGAQLPESIFPPILESQAIAGTLSREAAALLGLSPGIPVIVGCADQPAQALGNGITAPGKAAISVSSGGQVVTPFIPQGVSIPTDPRLHVFNHAIPGMWYILGAILSAGLSLRWLRHVCGMDALGGAAYEQFSAEAASVTPGAAGLIFLPYLTGERTPIMDAKARAGFIGLTAYHERGHLARAVMEGVAFALRQALEISRELGGEAESVVATGGGMESAVWRQILGDTLGLPLQKSLSSGQTEVGAALLGGVGVGIYSSFEEAGKQMRHYGVPTEPNEANRQIYAALYGEYCELYPKLRADFHRLGSL